MTEEENVRYNGFGDWLIPSLFYWLCDAVFAAIVLSTVCFVCEWRIRRRQG